MVKLKGRSWVLLALAGVILVAEITWLQQRQGFYWMDSNDFIEYWSAGQLLREGRNPYDFQALYTIEKAWGWTKEWPLVMWNPPWLLVLLYPLLMLPFGVAASIWFWLSLGGVLGCAVLIWRLFVPLMSPGQLLIPLLATIIFGPAIVTLHMGQVSVLLLLGIAGFLTSERKGSDFWAGTSLVLLTLKPHVTYLLWVAIAWWVIKQRRWAVLWGLVATLLVLCAFLTRFRPTWILDYVRAMRHPPLYWRAPVAGTVLRILFGWRRTWLQYLPSMSLCVLALVVLRRRREPLVWRDAVSPLLLLSVPTAAYGWSFDQLTLLVPYLQVVFWATRRHSSRLIAAIALVSINGLMLWSNPRLGDDLYLLWVPVAWGLVYMSAWRVLGGAQLGVTLSDRSEEMV